MFDLLLDYFVINRSNFNCAAIFEVQLTNSNQVLSALEDELAPDLDRGANVIWNSSHGA